MTEGKALHPSALSCARATCPGCRRDATISFGMSLGRQRGYQAIGGGISAVITCRNCRQQRSGTITLDDGELTVVFAKEGTPWRETPYGQEHLM